MHQYLITIFLHSGCRIESHGNFASDWAAVDSTFDSYHDARRTSVRRLA